MTVLVLLHAFPVDSRMWLPVRTALAGVAEVLTPDQGGLGRSALPAGVPTLETVADQVLDLLDARGVESAVVGGCSLGGYVAMALLRRAPHRVAGLVLVDTRHDADDAERAATRLDLAERVERDGIDWLADVVLPGLLAAGTPEASPDAAAQLRAMVADQSPAGVAWMLRAMASRPDSTEELRSYPGPALVVVGERDVLSPPEVARRMASLLPAAELVELPGCGHLSPVEAPAEVAAAITDWLSRIGAAGDRAGTRS